jgi:hypothetical protein
MQSIKSLLASQIDFGLPIGSEDLLMVPLLRRTLSTLRYQTLQAALAAGTLRITEVSDAGSVPEVRVVNDGELPVLLLDGAALVGAKQNRVLNLTILVPAHATTLVPVSCVEQGRWASRSPEFAEGDALHFAGARAQKMSSVSESLAIGAGRRSDQGEVWAKMADYAEEFRADAPSGAMQDVFGSVRGSADELLAGLNPIELQVGAAFVAQGKFLGMDLFDAPSTFGAEFPKIARSYAVEGLRTAGRGNNEPEARLAALQSARATVEYLVASDWRSYPGLGLGTDIRLTTSRLVAGALVHDDEIVHLAAFPAEAGEARASDTRAPAMPRRRYS